MTNNEEQTTLKAIIKPKADDIAIIGMACRFPGAKDYAAYWENLKNSVNSIREIPIDRWDTHQFFSEDPAKPETSVSKWAGLLDDIASFDHSFFHISSREAENMDPQQRLLLEEAWHCMEDAGMTPQDLQNSVTSVYVGVMAIDYQRRLADEAQPTDAYACLGNYEGILANRLSFYFGLSGESKSIDTACSSSLVALHDAKRSLNIGESDYAFAAGVSVICHPWKYISFSKSRMLSPDGQCKTFDTDANGYVPGEGVGILLLTSLENALKKGHRIHGVLKGTAVNHTGKSTSITAPRVEAQRDVIQAAQKSAGIDAESITYIEAHGTGTSLGDPIEVEGLVQAFHSEKTKYCALGSVKTNIGHLEAAAGVAGVIKVLLMLKHKALVPTLNVHTINPIIDFEHSPFYLSLEAAPWLVINNGLRVAGVSSFGFGGANAHVVLAEYSATTHSTLWHPILDHRHHPFVLSAKTAEALEALLNRWKEHVQSEAFSEQNLSDIAYTQVHGRESFMHRFAMMVEGKADLRTQLTSSKFKSVRVSEKNQTGALILMPCDNMSPAQWKILCDLYPALFKISAQCYQELNALKQGGMIKFWEKGEIKPEQKNVFQLMVIYVLGQWLLENGLVPTMITGSGIGVLAAAALSGLMDLSTALKIAINKEKKITLNHRTPHWTFSAPFLTAPIEPLLVSADYCLRLRQGAAFSEEALAILIDKSRLLIKNQFTFKQYIKEWASVLPSAGIEIYTILEGAEYELLGGYQKNILLVALTVSYKKLSEKWNLSDKIKIENIELSEVIDLILDDALSYEMAVELLHVETATTHLDVISKHLINMRNHFNKAKPYILLRQHTKLLQSITLDQWRGSLIKQEQVLSINDDLPNIQIGSGLVSQDNNLTKLRHFVMLSLQQFILELWEKGILRQLNQAILPLRGHVISSPSYPFLGKSFMASFSPKNFDENRILVSKNEVASSQLEKKSSQGSEVFYQKTEALLKTLISEVLKSDSGEIQTHESFENYGIDSIMITELNQLLEKRFPTLPKTLFFEYSNLSELTQYFVDEQKSVLEDLFKMSAESFSVDVPLVEDKAILIEAAPVIDIAIIGLSGRYPGAESLKEFWENLEAGRDSVTEIPKARWNHDLYFNPDRSQKNSTYGKWGGFLKDYDKFDTLFFNISPKEAELIDPQERLFLETAWSVLEDAGYTPQSVGRRVGVFVGVTFGQYQLYGVEHSLEGNHITPESIYGSVANRVSYYCNFSGPSLAVDTMCSSSLTALHLACESLRKQECLVALAGGVNIASHPNKYLFLARSNFLSSDGKCRSFGEGGDGYVPGEGVGAVLLKPLEQALRDNDFIYGIIKSTAINHGGKTHGYTVPNPMAQAALIKEALHKAHINPRTISYIESHGTGTNLGDPIEIRGLSKAFSDYTTDKQFCPIGSVKANIGHLESAAGIAALTKVLLQMKHKKLVPSIHSDIINQNINFEETPFYVQHQLEPWASSGHPLRAGISSFGAGGGNAHIIVEEWAGVVSKNSVEKPSYLIAISAKNEISFHQKILDLIGFLCSEEGELVRLPDLAYTLNFGREHFNCRGVFISRTKEDFITALKSLSLKQNPDHYFFADVRPKEPGETALNRVSLEPENPETYEKQLLELAKIYLNGYSVDWEFLHQGESKRRLPLPTYPFLRERYWVPDIKRLNHQSGRDLHPLVGSNISTLENQIFSKIYTGQEFYLKEHVILSRTLLPGVAYLEMAHAAGAFSSPRRRLSSLENIIWIKPLIFDGRPLNTHLLIYPEAEKVCFEVRSVIDQVDDFQVHAQGELCYDEPLPPVRPLNISDINARLDHEIGKSDFYAKLKAFGFEYGPSFQGIENIRSSEQEVLARLVLPAWPAADPRLSDFYWHPSLLDAALQATLGFFLRNSSASEGAAVPFALEKIIDIKPLPLSCYAYVVREPGAKANTQRYRVSILDEAGEILVLMEGFAVRPLKETAAFIPKRSSNVHYYQPVWHEKPLAVSSISAISSLLIFDEDAERSLTLSQALMTIVPESSVVRVQIGEAYEEIAPRHFKINPKNPEDFKRLLSDLYAHNIEPRHFINFWNYQPYELSSTSEDIQNYISQGVGVLFLLAKTLMHAKKKGPFNLLHVYEETPRKSHALQKMSVGFARSLERENPGYHCKVIGLDGQSGLSVLLDELVGDLSSVALRYLNGKRFVESMELMTLDPQASSALRKNGVYLITGGLGGIGFILAKYFASHYQAKLILSGRRPLDAEKEARLLELAQCGGEAFYVDGDIARYDDAGKMILAAKERFGALHGIFHCAGILRDSYIFKKSADSFYTVASAKIQGTLNLDKATAKENIDCFILFSSISSAFGNTGQSDYATANAFMDAFAANRNAKVSRGKRFGKTCSINWPLWEAGGMQVDASAKAALKQTFGMDILSTENAIEALESILALNLNQVGLIQGDTRLWQGRLSAEPKKIPASVSAETSVPFKAKLHSFLKEQIGKTLKIPVEKIKLDARFEEFGIDSIMVLELNRVLEPTFGALPKTLFFEYHDLLELSDYFISAHAEKVQELFSDQAQALSSGAVPLAIERSAIRARFKSESSSLKPSHVARDDIAIIGVSGRYPQADTLEEFWENLKSAKDSIIEIPKERWDYRSFYHPDKSKPHSVYAKWGGFINDYDKFDPLFFNISPKEAEIMDPQERLFLQTAWSTLEDAGYTPNSSDFRQLGVFVGVMYGHYQMYGAEETLKGHPLATSSSYASIANRVSFYLNSQGPSVALDTMCSSSLTAIHFACQSILQGECVIALAGGVNIATHSNKYLLLSEGKFLSSDGKCRSFGEGGDGYVPGEGVGAVLLKPLAQALADKDIIYAVIKASAINHGGKTNGYTVPNPGAQAALIQSVLKKANVDPRTISYVESHGTGTALGDPIEVRGLMRAYSEHTGDKQFCALGSVKSNIGHLESAAGIAALTKILLQLKHKMLVPSLHSETLNPHIDFSETPFYVQHALEEWSAPYPRRAALSSFGAGGSNAHLIIEEAPEVLPQAHLEKPYYLITLSAKHEISLQEKIFDLFEYLNNPKHGSITLADISYTLNVGRAHHNHRCVFLAESKMALMEALEKVKSHLPSENYFNSIVSDVIPDDAAIYEKVLQNILGELERNTFENAEHYKNTLKVLINLYMKGYAVDWELLHQGESPRRIALPTYPFLKEHYWVEIEKGFSSQVSEALHPLIDSNISTFRAQEFKKTINVNEFYVKGHVIHKQTILPGAAYLEMARVAGGLAEKEAVQHIRDIFWMRPLVMREMRKTIYLQLEPDKEDVAFEVYSKDSDERIIHVRGRLDYLSEERPEPLNIDDIRQQCERLGEQEWIYARYKAIGYDYGEGFKNTSVLWCNDSQALAKLKLTEITEIDSASYFLNPALMDAALRVVLGINRKLSGNFELLVPFYLEKLSIYEKIPEESWVFAAIKNPSESSASPYYDISICDEFGRVCVKLCGFNARAFEESAVTSRVMTYQPDWQAKMLTPMNSHVSNQETLLLITDDPEFSFKNNSRPIIHILLSDCYEKIDAHHYRVCGEQPEDFLELWRDLSSSSERPVQILHMVSSRALGISESLEKKDWQTSQAKSIYPLLFLFQAIEKQSPHQAVHYVFAYCDDDNEMIASFEALASFSSAAKLINPRFILKTIGFSSRDYFSAEVLLQEILDPSSGVVRYEGAERYVQRWLSVSLPATIAFRVPLKQRGTYLITGGLGGLGQIFSEFLAENYQAKLVLTGRSPINPLSQSTLEKLKSLGAAEVIYVQADISDGDSVLTLVTTVKQKFGNLDGILHAAGVADKTPLIKANISEFESGFSAKVYGTYFLDYFTRDFTLEFFSVFSSISAYLGDYGVGSYAYGNAFMDSYIAWREKARFEGRRSGVSVSLAWPYWESNGMSLSPEEFSVYHDYSGLDLLKANEGLDYFQRALSGKTPNLLILPGDPEKIEKLLGLRKKEELTFSSGTLDRSNESDSFSVNYLKLILSDVTKLSLSRISAEAQLQDYGVDSVMIIEINKRLSQDFPEIRKTLLFEYNTLSSLAKYLQETYPEILQKMQGIVEEVKVKPEQVKLIKKETDSPKIVENFRKPNASSSGGVEDDRNIGPIAIIGLSGRYPESENVDEFWENLQSGKDCITEIPLERWDYRPYYAPEKSKPGRMSSKWGGFIKDADKFDPLYFNIAPREAELMDPQERLMLQIGLKTIEDAGYSLELLHEKTHGSVGVFIGLMWNEYQLLSAAPAEGSEEILYNVSSNNSSISNRLSYAFDFHGPSLVIDTACSSSLVAIHLACENIRSGACKYAIAGGVNLSLHPSKYVNMSRLGMLSSDGRCRSFGEGGDGYVPGEGVGAILLKPLSEALRDNDFIYGVIVANAVNHGGKANGFTVPNPEAQNKVIQEALKKFHINPRSVSYIEAHGTGTQLGDPIEITGLTKAFSAFTSDTQFCSIGSVKSNVGHLESAAGIVGVSKVLLQLRHKKLIPSLHSAKLNPHIDFKKTPFYVQQKLEDWTVLSNPRRAGISSFGASGSNAHLIIEEAPERVYSVGKEKSHYLVTLSAKSKISLDQKVRDLLEWLQKNEGLEDLADISYTLNTGRDHFNHRIALVAESLGDLKNLLIEIQSKNPNENYFVGDITSSQRNNLAIYEDVLARAEEKLRVEHDVALHEYQKQLRILANLYVEGYQVNWELLHQKESKRRISLPSYPFLKERYWVPIHPMVNQNKSGAMVLSPLLDSNTSTLEVQRFKKTFSGQEFYFQDHVIHGEKLLPAVAYLEMARAAGVFSFEARTVTSLKNIIWVKPISIENSGVTATVSLFPESDDLTFEISTLSEFGESIIHAQGLVHYGEIEPLRSPLNIDQLKGRLTSEIQQANFYLELRKRGFHYGPAMQSVSWVKLGETEALVKLDLPENLGLDAYYWHPSLLDGALQATLSFILDRPDAKVLPFSLDEIQCFKSLPEQCYAYIQLQEGKSFRTDIQIVNDRGELLAVLKGATSKPIREPEFVHASEPSALTYCGLTWESRALSAAREMNDLGDLVVFDDDEERVRALRQAWADRGSRGKMLNIQSGENYQIISPTVYRINPEDEQHYEKLLIDLHKANISARCFVNAWSLASDPKDLDALLARGLGVLFHLSQALMKTEAKVKGNIRILHIYPRAEATGIMASGFSKTLSQENPLYQAKLVGVSPDIQGEPLSALIMQELSVHGRHDISVEYREDGRWVEILKPLKIDSNSQLEAPLREKGVYIITGGLGGLGLIIAEYLAKHHHAKLVLNGRSTLNADQEEKIQRLKQLGAEVLYVSANVEKFEDAEHLIDQAKTHFETVHGIIHSAGLIRDDYILHKKTADFYSVLAPKVKGTLNLDKATKDTSLDIFVLFSSLAGVFGNLGQCDYASANAFMDHFVGHRAEQVRQKKRFGKTLSIGWPLWEEGGMRVDASAQIYMENTFGIVPLSTEKGLEAFLVALKGEASQIGVLPGKTEQILKHLVESTEEVFEKPPLVENSVDHLALWHSKTEALLKEVLSASLKIPHEKLHSEIPFENYGIDSIVVLDLSRRLEKYFGSLPKTLFFEYRDISALTQYLLETYAEKLELLFSAPSKPAEKKAQVVVPLRRMSRKSPSSYASEISAIPAEIDDIAIIGVSGRYPMADNLSEFWQNLVAGKDCITEIPSARWDHAKFYDPDKNKMNRVYSKWGGFIRDHDKFDPLFFNISPNEAERMDPQERLFLETAWAALEDAGYVRTKDRAKVGVFVGVMYGEYQLYGVEEAAKGNPMSLHSSYASIANHVSYFCNFSGPSLALDTMCSSSLTALHFACESLRKRECHAALVGGVNVASHPNKYLVLSQGKFLSSDGRCRSFGEGGDGYVPGEGVGALFLKPLREAWRDKNPIYAVIKSTAVNHGGTTNSYTVPNPIAQAEVISDALNKANINPKTIQYVEAHGTGTALGDPIEIRGLTKAFNEFTNDTQFCAIGSVKSNIGHLESAAGIAALTKILLQFKHKKLVPSLHAETLNPHIDFSKTPFYVQRKTEAFSLERGHPCRMGVSAFGAGGSNAYAILEEAPEENRPRNIEKPCYLVTLSAKNELAFKKKILDLLEFLDREENQKISLEDISYTLNAGREHFSYRGAFVAKSISDLKSILEHMRDEVVLERYSVGVVPEEKSNEAAIYRKIFAGIIEELKSENRIDSKEYQENLETLANFYVKGYVIDWELLHQGEFKRRIPLPTYPFLRERYWVKSTASASLLPMSPSKPEAMDKKSHVMDSAHSEKLVQEISQTAVHVHPDYYAEEWETCELKLKPGALVAREHWLLFTNKKCIGTEIARILSMRKCEVTLVYVGDRYRKLQQHYQINPRLKVDMARLFDDIGAPVHGVIHAWADNINTIHSTDELAEAQELICASSLYLSQILAERKLDTKIYFILNGVHDISLAPTPLSIKSVAQATLVGLGKTLLIEHPELHVHLIDLDPESEIALAADHVLQVIGSQDDESIYAFRVGKCYVPRIRKTNLNHQGGVLEFQADKSYLITGGLGGLGFAAGRWLVKHGARHLILTSRREPTKEIEAQIAVLRQQGAHIYVLHLDLADSEAVDRLCQLEAPKIAGIIHAAGVQERERVANISWTHFDRVLRAKVQGTWNIQQLIARQSLQLDFVVLYSSIAALLGSNRDAPYAAGNAFLDAWASYQNQQGIPALRINWGPWGDVGMAAVGLELPGLISVPNGLKILGDVIAQKIPKIMVVSTEYLNFMFQFMPKPLFKWLPTLSSLELEPAEYAEKSNPLLDESEVDQIIKKALYKILPIDSRTLLSEKSDFFDLGMESIRALEFGRELQKEFNLKLSDAVIFDHPNIGELSAHLRKRFLEENNSQSQVEKIKRIKPQSSEEESYRLFCFPYAAGTRKIFSGWSDVLPKEIEVYPVDYTKGVSKNFPHDLKTVQEVAAELAEILPWDKPSFFFGSCLGSLVSWELAQILQAQNRPLPRHLFVAACAAPHLYPIAMKDTVDLIDDFRQKNKLPRFGREVQVEAWFSQIQKELAEIGPGPFLQGLEAVGFRDLSLLMENRAIFDVFYPRAVVDMSLALSFRSSDPDILHALPCSMTVFEGENDPLIRPNFMRDWQFYTKNDFELLKLKGDHYFIHDLKNEILNQIRQVFEIKNSHLNPKKFSQTTKS